MATPKDKMVRKTTPKINTSVNFDKIKPKVDEVGVYRCCCCGKEYNRQNANFNASKSPIYSGNNNYVTMCKHCVDQMYEKYVELYSGDEGKAVERICQLLDMYYDESVFATSRKVNANNSRISSYISRLNLNQNASCKTYSDTLKKRWAEDVKNITSFDQFDQIKDDDSQLDDETIKFFGLGFTEDEYLTLKYQYESWIQAYGEPADKVKEELYKQLSYQQLQIQKAIQSGDNISSLSNTYRNTLEAANLKVEKDVEQLGLDPYGKWVSEIEKYSPAEYFQDKKIYDDFDKLREYIERFIYRPLKNLFTGSKDLDNEFKVHDDKDDGS